MQRFQVLALLAVLSSLISCSRNREVVLFTTQERIQVVGIDYGTNSKGLNQSFALKCLGSKRTFYTHQEDFFPGADWTRGGRISPQIIENSQTLTLKGHDVSVTLQKSTFPYCQL